MKASVQLELKLIQRYLKPIWMFVFFLVFVVLWYLMDAGEGLLEQVNTALLMTVFLLSILGTYLQDFFWAGTSEPHFRFVHPVRPGALEEMILAKNLLLAGVAVCSLVPILVLDLLLFSGTLTELVNAIMYLGTAVFIFIHFGNSITIRYRRLDGERAGLAFLARNALTFVFASVPYLLFKVLVGSYLACIVFALAMGLFWYYHSLPRAARRLENYKYEIMENV